MRRLRDELTVLNERVKLLAVTVNALAIGLVGFAVLRPATEDVGLLAWTSIVWGSVGLALHVLAHYILGKLRTEANDDGL